jgi:hypothetical protein
VDGQLALLGEVGRWERVAENVTMINTDDISCRALGTIPTKRGGGPVDFHFEAVSGAGRRSG